MTWTACSGSALPAKRCAWMGKARVFARPIGCAHGGGWSAYTAARTRTRLYCEQVA
jgi:hypothetical protein